MSITDLRQHAVVPHDQWLAARTALLAKEKELTRARDELNRARRALPWERVDKAYIFDGPEGRETLADLFAGRSQLFVYHFMFGPELSEGCQHCSFWADHFDAAGLHLPHRDVSLVAVSRAPLPQIEPFKRRMGWRFKWVSSADSDFNYDFGASFTEDNLGRGTVVYNYAPTNLGARDREGASVFYRDQAGVVFHTYSCYARGIDALNGTYQILDLVAKGRDEDPDAPQSWVRYHDRY